jgi:ketosteroid isomerase-like protein
VLCVTTVTTRRASEARSPSDRDQIVELFTELAAALDACEWEAWGRLLTDDVVVHWKQWGPLQGRDVCVQRMSRGREAHASSQRMVSNHRVRVDGLTARAVACYRSAHISGKDRQPHAHEGWYVAELARDAPGWRFSKLRKVDLDDVLLDEPAGLALTAEIYGHTSRR